jgi:hypothetical protein
MSIMRHAAHRVGHMVAILQSTRCSDEGSSNQKSIYVQAPLTTAPNFGPSGTTPARRLQAMTYNFYAIISGHRGTQGR